MPIDLASFLGGLLLGILATVSFVFPRVGRILARTFSVSLFIGGIGLLAWSIGGMVLEAPMTAFDVGPVAIASVSDAVGWGSGLLAGGILTLVLSSLSR